MSSPRADVHSLSPRARAMLSPRHVSAASLSSTAMKPDSIHLRLQRCEAALQRERVQREALEAKLQEREELSIKDLHIGLSLIVT